MTKKKTSVVAVEATEVITSYKGFDKNMKCRDYQFEIGKTYTHEGDVEACESGFHACEYPLGVFSYYAPPCSVFCVVEQSGSLSRHDKDSKIASSSISIKASIDLPGLVAAAFEFVTKRCEPVKARHSKGDRSASSATGDMSASLTTGSYSTAEVVKPNSHSVAIGAGFNNKARADEGCAIVLCYRNITGQLINIRASKVGDNGIKPNVWYLLDANGEFVEIAE